MPARWPAKWGRTGTGLAAALGFAAAAAAPPENGMPLVSTFLPSRYNTPATPVGPQTFALAAMTDGSIVAANNAGLLRLDGTSATAWNPIGGNVLSLGRGADGKLYLGGVGAIGWVGEFGRKFEPLTARASALGVTLSDVWVTVPARGGDVYFADTTHVFRWDGKDLSLVYTGQPELLVGAPLDDGAAIIDPGKGLIALDAHGAHAVPGGERLLAAAPCALTAAGAALLSICSDGRVQRWTAQGAAGELALGADVRRLLAEAGVTTAGMRDDGMLLVGTRRGGIVLLERDGRLAGQLANVPEWGGDSRVFSELWRSGDGFWVGLDYGVAHVEWPGQLSRLDAGLGLPRAALATARLDGTLIAATTRGAYRLTPPAPGTAFAHFEPFVPTHTTLFAMAEGGGALWLASGEGVYRVSGRGAERIDTELAYVAQPIDARGEVVLAGGLSGARLLRRAGAGWQATPLVQVESEVRHVLRDSDGALWLSGNYSNVYRCRCDGETPQIEAFGTAAGLPPGRIIPLLLPAGHIAFDSSAGALRFDAAQRRFVPDAALRALLPRANGTLRASVVLDAERALVIQHDRVRLIAVDAAGWRELDTPLARLPRGLDYRDVRLDADGAIWIAGNEALFRHEPRTQATLPALPQPRIALVGDETAARNGTAPLDLGAAPRTVRARFEEAFFDGVEQLRFRTRLAPLEHDWSDWQALPQREMTQLPGGDYVLAVQVRDIFGRESAPAELAFALAPPWWQRGWALAVYAVALGLLLAALVRRREARLRRRTEELAELVSARTQELERASVTDALTGLRNRHYVQLLEPSWRERRRGFWLIALVDIDHFKRINDLRGHAAGDEVLRAVARRLAGVLSEAETAVRWGGEEFLIVGELERAELAAPLMRKLLCAIGDVPIAVADAAGGPVAVTVSIGWEVVAVKDALTLDAMLLSADRKLYAAKHGGRDRACGPQDAVLVRKPA